MRVDDLQESIAKFDLLLRTDTFGYPSITSLSTTTARYTSLVEQLAVSTCIRHLP